MNLGERYPLRESRIATRLGVARDLLRGLRSSGALQQGQDWEFVGTTVCYAEGSVTRIMQHLDPSSQSMPGKTASQNAPGCADDPDPRSSDLDAEKAADAASQEADAVEKAALVTERLTVTSRPAGPGQPHFRNARVVQARRVGGDLVMVRTHDSRMYRAGASLQAYDDGNGWIISGRPPRRVR